MIEQTRSGLLGASGMVRRSAQAPRPSGRRGRRPRRLPMFVRSAAKAIAAMLASLGGADLLVYTGGVGEHDEAVRTAIVAAPSPGPASARLPACCRPSRTTRSPGSPRKSPTEASLCGVYAPRRTQATTPLRPSDLNRASIQRGRAWTSSSWSPASPCPGCSSATPRCCGGSDDDPRHPLWARRRRRRDLHAGGADPPRKVLRADSTHDYSGLGRDRGDDRPRGGVRLAARHLHGQGLGR